VDEKLTGGKSGERELGKFQPWDRRGRRGKQQRGGGGSRLSPALSTKKKREEREIPRSRGKDACNWEAEKLSTKAERKLCLL